MCGCHQLIQCIWRQKWEVTQPLQHTLSAQGVGQPGTPSLLAVPLGTHCPKPGDSIAGTYASRELRNYMGPRPWSTNTRVHRGHP